MIFLLHLFMKLKLTLLYVVSFLALLFFVHEVHDWAHTLMARIISGCWGPRGFDSWAFCAKSSISSGQRMLADLAGPFVNFVLLWIGWQKMDQHNTLGEQSLGCSLVFATLPLNMLLAAASSGGDLTSGIRLLFPHGNHRVISLVGLLIVVLVCVPPLVKAFVVLPWWQGRIFFYPFFLIVPGFFDHWFVGKVLNKWLIKTNTSEESAYLWVILWTLLNLVILLFTYRRLKKLISDEELPL
jgi:hypothetical protein